MAELDKYTDAEGHVFSLTKEDAQRRGYTPLKAPPVEEETEEKAQSAPRATKAVSAPPANKGR